MNNNYFKGLPIQGRLNDFNKHYLNRIIETIDYAVDEHKRTYGLRVDLRFPSICQEHDCLSRDEIINEAPNRNKLISKFIESLKAKICAKDKQDRKLDKRVWQSNIRYIWCRERKSSENDHYHVVLFFNKDKFHLPGNYQNSQSLYSLITSAWISALGLKYYNKRGLVQCAQGTTKYLDKNSADFDEEYSKLFKHVSYLAKKHTKHYGEGNRNFGCSQR